MRVLSAGLAAQGAFMVWIARYGTLWDYETELGWFAPYVLRPGMYAIGTVTVVMGLWYAWLAYTGGARVLEQWVDDIRHDLQAGAVGDLGWREVVRLYAHELWNRRGCLVGSHGLENLNYFPGEGTVCENCGLRVALRLSWSDRFWLAIRRPQRVEDKWSATLARVCPPLPALSDSILVLHPDGQYREEDAPDDRFLSRDKEA
jgi:hypothetical protein